MIVEPLGRRLAIHGAPEDMVDDARNNVEGNKVIAAIQAVGRCKLNSVDPSFKSPPSHCDELESDRFQTLTLEHQSWFQNVPFKYNLRRYKAVVPVSDYYDGVKFVTTNPLDGRAGTLHSRYVCLTCQACI
jgi:hypothetical protein